MVLKEFLQKHHLKTKRMKLVIVIFALFNISALMSQNETQHKLPYYELPEYSETFTAGTVAARTVDGLGFRFYWATKDLTAKDLMYTIDGETRTTEETVNHILNLSHILLYATLQEVRPEYDVSSLNFEEKRAQTLLNLEQASKLLKVSDDISKFTLNFGDNKIPFWNAINGPIADSIWHCGQIASFRRLSGNPIHSGINHFTGTVKE